MTLPVPLCVRLKTASRDIVTSGILGLEFSDGIPGGFKGINFDLVRQLALEPAELTMYADLYVYDTRNAKTVWQGRLEDPGRVAGPSGQLRRVVGGGAWARAFDRTEPVIYVDRTLDTWTMPSAYATRVMAHESYEADEDTPGLRAKVPQGATVLVNDQADFIYRAVARAGMSLARVRASFDAGLTNANYELLIATREGIGSGTTADLATANTAGGALDGVVVTDFPNGHNVWSLRVRRITSNTTPADDSQWFTFDNIVTRTLLRNKAGSQITAGYTLNTVLASEIIEDLLGSFLPNFDGANARVDATTFGIEQCAYPDGIKPGELMEEMMRFEMNFYAAAWEDGPTPGLARFEWRAWPTTVRYEATVADGFEAAGSGIELYNVCKVRWRDAKGRTRVNIRTQVVPDLDAADLTRVWFIDLSDEVGSSLNADRVGDQFLAEHASAPNAGTLTIRRPILDLETGRRVQPWEVRSGHLIRVRDVRPRVDALNATGRDGATVFRMVEGRYSADQNERKITLDSPARRLSQIVGRRPRTRRR